MTPANIPKPVPFYIHSTFRDDEGAQVKPHGLEWGMFGDSYVSFIPASVVHDQTTKVDLPDCQTPEMHRGIVEAYNRWAFSREFDFKDMTDIATVKLNPDGKHVDVQWKSPAIHPHSITKDQNMEAMLKDDPAAKGGPPAEVWVNGVFAGLLNGEMSLSPILLVVKRATGAGTRWAYKRSEGCIRIEKYFRGMIRKNQVFEHVMDNLIAMEDPKILGPNILIGTATLPDWIMGGELTSRLHVEELENGDLKFVRPLYDDDVSTADRHFGLFRGRDDVKIAMVRKELDRLRLLAAIPHPDFPHDKDNQGVSKSSALNAPTISVMGYVPPVMVESSSSSSSLVFIDENK